MTQKLKVIVIGAGNVGLEVARQSRGVGYDVVAQVSSRAFIPLAGAAVTFDRRGDAAEIMMTVGPFCLKHGVKLALLTIPSSGDGSTETRYILSLTGVGIAVVTSGKSAFASFYDVLRPHLDTIGRTATVGGGTRILPELKERLDPTVPFVVDLVVNGTLSKVMSDIWKGSSVEAAIWEAIHLKYAEPPADGEEMSPLDVFQGELSDIRKKLAIILNDVPSLHAMSGQTVRPEDIEMQPLSDEYLHRITAQNVRRKFVARISTQPRPLEGLDCGAPGSISARIGELIISGGFCHIPAGTAMDRWVPDHGPGNAVRIDQEGDPILVLGVGAGPVPTAKTMIADAKALCPLAPA